MAGDGQNNTTYWICVSMGNSPVYVGHALSPEEIEKDSRFDTSKRYHYEGIEFKNNEMIVTHGTISYNSSSWGITQEGTFFQLDKGVLEFLVANLMPTVKEGVFEK